MTEKARRTRENENRESEERKKVWRPPQRLPKFEDQDPDNHYRWVRRELRGQDESSNVLSRIREGYEPVKPEEVGLYDHPTIEDGRFAGTVISGDLMLMRIPKYMAEQREKYFKGITDRMQGIVDQELKDSDDDLMPISKSVKTSVTMGKPHFKSDKE